MNDKKKDLTRIEDLGEFIHELNADEDEFSSLETMEESPEEVPNLPESEDNNPFGLSFDSPEDTEETKYESNNFETPEFESSTDFETSFSDNEENEDEPTPSWALESEASEEVESPSDEELFTSTAELGSEVEEISVPEPIKEVATPEYKPDKEYKTPETFEDLRKFSESSSFTGMATEGNPSFSILIKNVRFIEDINDIVTLLRELKLMVDTEELTRGRLMRGMLLIPRVSEYAAIFLAHKLRRFDIDIQIGLSDEIHPPKHQETPETGIVSKFNLFQNQSHHFEFDDPKLDLSQIIIASTPTLEGYHVLKYMGVATEHKILDADIIEDESSSEVPRHYQELAQKLKAHALKAHSNAVVGLNYQLTPIPSEHGIGGHKYRLSCTGNLVWINKL